MIPTYCLTLSQTPERTAIATEHFRQRGSSVTMFNGVHGKTWGIGTEQWFRDKRDAGNWLLPPGHVGLNLSHWMLWSYLWHAGLEEAIVLEDDAILCPDFLNEYERTRKSLPADWQFCYLGTVGLESRARRTVNNRLCTVSGCVFGTHAYLVRRSALPMLMDGMQSCRDHVDIQLSALLPKLQWYAAWPNLVRQRTADGQWQGCCHQDYISPPPRTKRDEAVAISQELQGWCPEEKAGMIYDAVNELAVKFSEPIRGVEIGVWGGRSLIPAALAMRDLGRGHITGIDPYTKEAAIDGLASVGDEGRHREAWANGTYGEYAQARDCCLKAIEENGVGSSCGLLVTMPDVVAGGFERLHYLHIDDSHSTTTSCRNVQKWMPKIVSGGLLVLDDAAWPSVQPARAMVRGTMSCREDLCDQSPGRRWEVYERS